MQNTKITGAYDIENVVEESKWVTGDIEAITRDARFRMLELLEAETDYQVEYMVSGFRDNALSQIRDMERHIAALKVKVERVGQREEKKEKPEPKHKLYEVWSEESFTRKTALDWKVQMPSGIETFRYEKQARQFAEDVKRIDSKVRAG